MSKAWDDIKAEFPDQFLHIRGPMECGDGWKDLIRSVCLVAKATGLTVRWDCIKEKFGSLRMYFSADIDDTEQSRDKYDALSGAADIVDKLSYFVCETCGKPGRLRTGGWLFVACDECDRPRAERSK